MDMPATELTDQDVISLMRKEYDKKLKNYCEKNGIDYAERQEETPDAAKVDKDANQPSKPDELEVERISPGIRLRHKDSALEYSVLSINVASGQVTLETPEGRHFQIATDELEQDYELG